MLLNLQREIILYILAYIVDLRDISNLRVSSKVILTILQETTRELTFSSIDIKNLLLILGQFPNVRKISGKIFSLTSRDYYEGKMREKLVSRDLEKLSILRRITVADILFLYYSPTMREMFIQSFARGCKDHKSCLRCKDHPQESSERECIDCRECKTNSLQEFKLTVRHIFIGKQDSTDRYKRDLETEDEKLEYKAYVKIVRGKLPSYIQDVKAKSLVEGKLVVEDANLLRSPGDNPTQDQAKCSAFLYSLLDCVQKNFNIQVAYIQSFLYTRFFPVIVHDISSPIEREKGLIPYILVDLYQSVIERKELSGIRTFLFIHPDRSSYTYDRSIESLRRTGMEVISI